MTLEIVLMLLLVGLGLSPSKVLIPLSYASILGGTLTLRCECARSRAWRFYPTSS